MKVCHSTSIDGNLNCCLNNYSETDGSFKFNDFVYRVKYQQESGNYYCSCSIYKTLLNVRECTLLEDDCLFLDTPAENCVACMHCKFVKEMVVPYLPEEGRTMRIDELKKDYNM